MQDRFKFRTWDDKFKKFRNGLAFQDNCLCSYDDNVCTLEQCTGLKDKNGNLIFEGDIVEYKIPGIPKISAIVHWSPNSVHFWKGSQDLATYKKTTVIVGNIHENPELIPKSEIYRY